VELATLPNVTYPGDLFPSSRFYAQDLGEPALELTPRLTFQPFSGALPTPHPERLAQLTVRHARITAPRA